MRIFLAGATGVIGIRLLPLVIADGHTVAAAADRSRRGLPSCPHPGGQAPGHRLAPAASIQPKAAADSGRQPGWQPLNGRRIIHLTSLPAPCAFADLDGVLARVLRSPRVDRRTGSPARRAAESRAARASGTAAYARRSGPSYPRYLQPGPDGPASVAAGEGSL